MIKRIKIKGDKSLRDVEIHFEPLSIIIGPNGAGKSNLLDALNLTSRIVTSRNLKDAFEQHRGLPLESFYYGEKGYEKLLEREMAEAHLEVDVELSESTINGYPTRTVNMITVPCNRNSMAMTVRSSFSKYN